MQQKFLLQLLFVLIGFAAQAQIKKYVDSTNAKITNDTFKIMKNKILLPLICFLAFFITNNTSAQVINYNESVSGDISNTASSNAFTLNTAGVHTWTCNLEPTPFPGGVDRFQVVVPAGFVITSYTYNLTSIAGVDVTHGFDATLSYTPNTVGSGTANNSINYTFPTPKPAGTYDIETVGNFVPSNRPYTVTVTTAISCSNLSVSVISQTNISCFGGSNGAISINTPTGGAAPYTYNWTPGNPTGDGTKSVSGLTAGAWTCTITDANSCTITKNFTLTQPTAALNPSVSQTNVSCNGGNDGSASVIAGGGTPGYTYLWAPSGGTGATASGLRAGTYTCTITDAKSCTTTRTFTITQPPALTSSIALQTNVSCNGGNNGSATVTAGGGTPGYTYSWAPSGGTGATASGLIAGTYTCTIKDANLCAINQTVTINQPATLAAPTANSPQTFCTSGTIANLATTSGSNIKWYNTATAGTLLTGTTALVNGTTYYASQTNGTCESARTAVTVTINTLPTLTLGAGSIICEGTTSFTIPYTATTGSPTTYSISGPGMAAVVNASLPASPITINLGGPSVASNYTYTMTVSNAAGCTSNAITPTLAVVAVPTITAGATNNPTTCAGTNGSIVFASTNVPNGTYSLTYTGTGSPKNVTVASNAFSLTGLSAGNYSNFSLTYGCAATNNVTKTLSNPALPTLTLGAGSIICEGTTSFTIPYTATTGSPTTYSISGPGMAAVVNASLPLSPITINLGGPSVASNYTYTITVSNAAGCTSNSITPTLAVVAVPTITAGATNNPTTCAGTNGSIAFTSTNIPNGTYSLTYIGTGSPKNVTVVSNAFSLTGLSAGNYSNFSLTYGCAASNNVTKTLSDPVLPTLTLGSGSIICAGATSFSIAYTATTGSPTTYSISGPGVNVVNAALTSSPLTFNLGSPSSIGNYTYTMTVKNAEGCTSTTISPTLAVVAVPSAPTATATQDFCGSGTVANLAATGTTIQWYAAATGGSALPNSTSLTTATNYYASQTNASSCESDRTMVTVTINPTSFIVTNLNDAGLGSFRQALLDANASTCNPMVIDATGVTGTIVLLSALPNLNNDITINGPTSGNLTVSRDATQSAFRIFEINASKTVAINNITITNGANASQAGGVYNAGSLSMLNCIITNCASPQGGGLQSDGKLKMINCVVANNSNNAVISYGAGNIDTFMNCTFAEGLNEASSNSAFLLNNIAKFISVNAGATAGSINNTIYNNNNNSPFLNGSNGNVVGAAINPLFINASSTAGADGLFRTADDGLALQTVSPAVNTGSATNYPASITTDVMNTNRTKFLVIDRGAYENGILIEPLFTQIAPLCAGTSFTLPTTSTNGIVGTWLPAINTTTTTTYTFTPTATACMCYATAQMQVVVNPVFNIVYVDSAIAASGNGSTWATAFKTLQEALNNTCATQVWVKKGTYYPTLDANSAIPTNPRTKTFLLKSGTGVYGGFNGTETLLSQANPTTNVTVLSGDFNNDDVVTNANNAATLTITGNTENAYHVVTSNNPTAPITLNGFTISGGNADASINPYLGIANRNSYGAGVFSLDGGTNFTISQCLIKNNNALYGQGGGIYFNAGSPTITNCKVFNNIAYNGGGIFSSGNTNMSKLSIFGNKSDYGGGLLVQIGNYNIDGIAVYNNYANSNGGGIYVDSKSTNAIRNAVVYGNNSGGLGSGIFNRNSLNQAWLNASIINNWVYNVYFVSGAATPIFTNSIIWGAGVSNQGTNTPNYTNCNVQGVVTSGTNISTNPIFRDINNPAGADGIWLTADDGLQLACGSPCYNTGTNTGAPLLDILDSGIYATTKDMGAYESQTNLTLVKPTFTQITPQCSGTSFTLPTTSLNGIIGTWSPAIINTTATTTYTFTPTAVVGVCNDTAQMQVVINPIFATVYVDGAISASGNGGTWATAYKTVQEGINACGATQVWVKNGTYYPTLDVNSAIPANAREKTFLLKSGVSVYGGFAGTETLLSQRNIATNPTILSGDIGTPITNTDNSYHVVMVNDPTSPTILDGFTVQDGYADGSSSYILFGLSINYWDIRGAGVFIYSGVANFKINNCVIKNNSALAFLAQNAFGGGVYAVSSNYVITNSSIINNSATGGGGIFNSSSSPTITHVTITNNSATNNGGGILNVGFSPTLTNVTIANNSATNGGGIFNNTSSPTLTNVTIANNSATNNGGGVNNTNTSIPNIINCTIYGNSCANSGGGLYYSNVSGGTLKNSILFNNTTANTLDGGREEIWSENTSTTGTSTQVNVRYSCVRDAFPMLNVTDGGNNINSNPLFANPTNSTGADGVCMTADDGLQLNCTSPCVNTGDNTGAPALDILGNARVGANKDMGAYENQVTPCQPIFTGSTTCETYTVANVTGNAWFDVMSPTGIVASINPNGLNLGTLTVEISDPSNTLTYQSGRYLGRTVNVTSSNYTEGVTMPSNYSLRLYYYDTELNEYNTAMGLTTTATDYNVVWKQGGTACGLAGATASGTVAKANITTAEYGTDNNGFSLSFDLNHFTLFAATTTQSSLPIDLLDFTGKKDKNDNILSWTTASEQNSDYFELQHSTDGKSFETLGTVAAAGESRNKKQYDFTHLNPRATLHYYRLKMVDKDGSFKYSAVISLINSVSNTTSLYPNPTNNNVNIRTVDYSQPVRLFNATGALLYSSPTTPTVLDLRAYPAGLYIVHIGQDVLRIVRN